MYGECRSVNQKKKRKGSARGVEGSNLSCAHTLRYYQLFSILYTIPDAYRSSLLAIELGHTMSG